MEGLDALPLRDDREVWEDEAERLRDERRESGMPVVDVRGETPSAEEEVTSSSASRHDWEQ